MSAMRILDLQRRLREIGRIRIGEQTATPNGRKRPVKLEVFRLTSRDRTVIEAAASVFGGTPEPWADAPDAGQWQVKTTATEFQVAVPHGEMSFSQAYEQWTAGGCKVRCDGQWDHLNDKACHCDPTNRACAIHSRLSVVLPDLPGVGVWRLDTSGYYAAVELGGVVDLAASYAAQGRMLPARLRLEQRSVKRIKPNGQPETRRFAVPVLDLDVNLRALTSGEPVAAIGAPSFSPVPAELPSVPTAPVAEQVPSLGAGDPTPKRANAAAPIPATGVEPRTARDAADDLAPPQIGKVERTVEVLIAGDTVVVDGEVADAAELASLDRIAAIKALIARLDPESRADLRGWWAGNRLPKIDSGDLTADQADEIEKAIRTYPGMDDGAARNKRMWALVAEAWPDDDTETRDRKRKALISRAASSSAITSSKDLDDDGWEMLFDSLDMIKDGSHELFLRSNNTYELRRKGGAK